MKKLLAFCFFAGLVACQKDSQEEKMVNAEFSKIQANWVISSFNLQGQGSDSLGFVFSSGNIKWDACKYTDEGKYSQLCGGDFSLNGLSAYLTYLYDLESKTYKLGLLNGAGQTDQKLYESYSKILRGEWKLEVSGDMLSAQQVQNDSVAGLKASFTAKRQ